MADESGSPRRRRRRRGERAGARRDPAGPPAPIDDPEQARAICLAQLAWAPRTRSQLATAMRRRGVTEDVAEPLLARFEEVGLIDDVTFAASWVQSRHTGRGIGRHKLAQELRNRGVAGELVRDAVGTLSPDTERATARVLVERRLAATAGQPAAARARRLASVLARKGYPAGLAYEVVREVLAADGTELPEVDVPFEPDDPGITTIQR